MRYLNSAALQHLSNTNIVLVYNGAYPMIHNGGWSSVLGAFFNLLAEGSFPCLSAIASAYSTVLRGL